MECASSYEELCGLLADKFRSQYPHAPEARVRMVGLLFAHPKSPLATAEIVPKLGYYNLRSGRNIDFFCAGYVPGQVPEQDAEYVTTVNGMYWYFSDTVFTRFRGEIEDATRAAKQGRPWRYSGGVDLILTNARYDPSASDGQGKAFLDYTSKMALNLDRAKADGAILSVETLFEQIFQFAEEQPGDDPTWGLSDRLGGSAFLTLLANFIPERFRNLLKIRHFAVT